jgi:DNA-binding transcriptional ArsR family regulator
MSKPFLAASPQQLATISSPGREEIIDAVALIGPCSIPDLAEKLGRSRHSLYYHVKALRDCGLLIETQRSGEGARTTGYYDVPGRPFSVSFDLVTDARRAAVLTIARARAREAMRGFERACRPEVAETNGPLRNLRATHLKGWLTADELEHANALMEQLIALLGSPTSERSPDAGAYELTLIFAPHTVNVRGRLTPPSG